MKMQFLQERASLPVAVFFTVIFSALSVMFTNVLFLKILLAVSMAISVALVTGETMAKGKQISTMEELDDGKNRKYLEALKHSEGNIKLSIEGLLSKDNDDDTNEREFAVKNCIKGSHRSFTLRALSREIPGDRRQELLYQKSTEGNKQSLTMKAFLRDLDDNNGQNKHCRGKLKLAMEALISGKLHKDLEDGDLLLQKNTEGKRKLPAMEALLRKFRADDTENQELYLEKTSEGNINLRLGKVTMCRHCRRVASVPEEEEEQEERRGYGEEFPRFSHLQGTSGFMLQNSSSVNSFRERCHEVVCNKTVIDRLRCNDVEASAHHGDDEESIIKHQILPVERCDSDHISANYGDSDAKYDRFTSNFATDSSQRLSGANYRANNEFPDCCSSTFAANRWWNDAKYGVNDAKYEISLTCGNSCSRRLNNAKHGVDDGVTDRSGFTYATNMSRGLNDVKCRVNDGISSPFASYSSKRSRDDMCGVNDGISCGTCPTLASNPSRRKNHTNTPTGITTTCATRATREIEEITDAELQDAANEFYTLEGDVLWTECDLVESKKKTDQYSQCPCKARYDTCNIIEGSEIVHNVDSKLQGQSKQNGKLKVAMVPQSTETIHSVDLTDEETIKMVQNVDIKDYESMKVLHIVNPMDHRSIQIVHNVDAMDHESIKMVPNMDAMDDESLEMVHKLNVMDDGSMKIVHSVDSIESKIKEPAKLKLSRNESKIQEVQGKTDGETVIGQRLRAISFRSENMNTGDESNYMSMPGSFREVDRVWSPPADDGCMDMEVHKREESTYGCCDDHGRPCMAHSRSRSKILQTDPLLSKASLSLREQEIMDILWQEQYNEHKSICFKKGSRTRTECENSLDEYINLNGYDCNSNRNVNKNTCLLGCKTKACWHNVDKDQRGYQRRRYFIGICRALREMGLKQCLQSSNVSN